MRNLIAIVAGEPNSINSEIISNAWKNCNRNLRKNIFIIGNYLLLKKQLKIIKSKISITKIKSVSDLNNKYNSNNLRILNIPLKFKNPFNVKIEESSHYILRSLDLANEFAIKNKIKGFINCSINKKNVFKSSKLGVTEYLSKKNKTNNAEVMLIYNKNLSVVPITTHVNIKDISKNISKKLIIKKIKTLSSNYLKIFKKKPKIALLGLNPHNGELRVDSEEKKIILPAMRSLVKQKIDITGPFSADTIFSQQKKYNYNVIVGMYHDQVLAPFKAIYNFNAINITLGLKYLRVSPDHGTAKDIIGLNKANYLSLLYSIKFILKHNLV